MVGTAIIDAATLRRRFRKKLPDPRSARFRSKSNHSAVNCHHHALFYPNACEAAPKVMSWRPGTPPRLFALFVHIRPTIWGWARRGRIQGSSDGAATFPPPLPARASKDRGAGATNANA